MSNETIADVPGEGDVIKDNAFEKAGNNVEQTTSESQPENKQAEKPSQGGEPEKDNTPEEQTPFHKHPRWIKTQKQLEEYRQKAEEFEKFKKDVEPLLKERQTEVMPDWWKTNYGDTPDSKEAYRRYQEATKAERDRIKSEVIEEIKNEQSQSTQVEAQAKDYIQGQLEEMKSDGLQFETNELMKFVLDFEDKYGVGSLLDAEGNYDLRKSLDLMQEIQPKTQPNSTEIKKKLASETMRTKGVSSKDEISTVSRRMLRKGTWRDALK